MLKRFVLLLGGPLAALAIVAVALVSADLPDPIATHWDGGGRPDGHTPPALFFAAIVLVCVAAWAFLLVHARRRQPAGARLTAAPFAWAALAFASATGVVTVDANAGAASWREAGSVGVGTALLVVAAGALAALAAWTLERGRPLAPVAEDEAAVAALRLEPGEQAVWSRAVASGAAVAGCVAIGGGLVVAGVLVGGGAGWALVAGGVVAAIAIGAVSEIVVTVDARGLGIAYGPLGWPRQTVPLADVAHAEPTRIDPWRVGGWGYRKAPGGATAVVLRGGEGLRVVRRDGRVLLVTVPDAATAAALLNALGARVG